MVGIRVHRAGGTGGSFAKENLQSRGKVVKREPIERRTLGEGRIQEVRSSSARSNASKKKRSGAN